MFKGTGGGEVGHLGAVFCFQNGEPLPGRRGSWGASTGYMPRIDKEKEKEHKGYNPPEKK